MTEYRQSTTSLAIMYIVYVSVQRLFAFFGSQLVAKTIIGDKF